MIELLVANWLTVYFQHYLVLIFDPFDYNNHTIN